MQTPQQVLDANFLESRSMLIEVAAMLDRYDRAAAGQTLAADPRLEKLYESISVLAARNAAPNRAERLLNLYSE